MQCIRLIKFINLRTYFEFRMFCSARFFRGRVGIPVLLVCLLLYVAGCKQESKQAAVGDSAATTNTGAETLTDANREPSPPPEEPAIHVRPGEDVQAAMDRAAAGPIKRVVVHAGVYRPKQPQQALIWFNKVHDGLQVIADGDVTLTSANSEVADRNAKSFPSIANHVVYFGDGISSKTKFSGFTITGANNFVTTKGKPIEAVPTSELKRTSYFYFDGGGIKIYGRSYPVLEGLRIIDNYSSPCGAGISVEHRGHTDQFVTIRNCVFRNNRVPITGAALDLLGHDKGSAARVENCLFVGNASNCSMDSRSLKLGSWMPKVGHGAITLFKFSKAEFRNCTIVGNRNGVDDMSPLTSYEDCIFWDNGLAGGWATGKRYETAIVNTAGFKGCFVGGGGTEAQRAPLDAKTNVLDAPDPEFDERYIPQNPIYGNAGYRANAGPAVAVPGQTSPVKANLGSASQSESPLAIRALGFDYNWYFSYSGSDGVWGTEDDVCTRRHLYVPAGRPVELELNSKDYLYSFKLPDQAMNQIAIPGVVHRASFTEATSGTYPLTGDQFCGYIHPNLIGRMIVQSEAQFSKSIIKNSVTPPF